MAESSFWEKSCESCLEEEKQVKARTLCFECQEFLCGECSEYHLRFKKSKGHHLIDLVPFKNKPDSSTSNEDELSSDFLENLTISDNTVLYGAQVAIEKKEAETTSTTEKDTKAIQNELSLTKCLEFSVEIPVDKARLEVRSIVCLEDKIAVAIYRYDAKNKLRLFDRQGNFLYSIPVSEEIWGMTSVESDTFASCGTRYIVRIWNIDGQSKINETKEFKIDSYMSQGIHFNGTHYCVLHVGDNAISVLDTRGNATRKTVLKEAFGKKIKFERDIHMDKETNTIYVPCREDGLLSISIQGQPLWFCPLEYPMGVTEIHGTLFVVDFMKKCFHVLSKTGSIVGKIPKEDKICGNPWKINYGQDGRLYQGFHRIDKRRNMIFVYSVTLSR